MGQKSMSMVLSRLLSFFFLFYDDLVFIGNRQPCSAAEKSTVNHKNGFVVIIHLRFCKITVYKKKNNIELVHSYNRLFLLEIARRRGEEQYWPLCGIKS